ncbi:outer membrane protein assembly factor [Polymorphobacter arshaanensis]|uniref:Outer membrane protein assembly factor n=2 Tax=Glacieibacterium arshaanense TaxID=2511025 RepID=A0A4Y9EN28_9SPHN|nr:outer membrane protein assembly factor [Polymorphobacter arshaanensis]
MVNRVVVSGTVLALMLYPVAAMAAAPVATAVPTTATVPETPTAPTESPFFDSMAPLPGNAVPWPTLENTAAPADATPITDADVRYVVVVTGLSQLNLMARFNETSLLHKGRNEPSNIAQIRRRTTADVALIDQLLRSVGYYGGTITPKIVPPAAGGTLRVEITVEPGPLYKFTQIDIISPTPADVIVASSALGLTAGTVVAAAPFDAAQAGLRGQLAAKGHPFPEIGDPDIVIDHAAAAALLTQKIDPGPLGRFGAVKSEGSAQITTRHMQRMVRFKPGEVYSAAEVEDLRRALIATNLYGSVVIKPVNAGTNPDGTAIVDLIVTGETAPLRTVSASAGYSTGEGFRVAGSWQHRNLLPPQGQVTFSGLLAQREIGLGAELRRRNWLKRDRTLVLAGALTTQNQDAFDATTATIGGLVELETNLIWQKKWYYSLGVEFAASNEADLSASTGPNTPRTMYYILSAPLSLSYDGSNDLLNPERGFRINMRASPQVSFESGSFAYVRAQLEGTYYQPVASSVTLAGRLHFGSIIGASRGNIAPTRRFYAGGGGSVRGYNFQQVGPKDAQGVPTGGNSLTEVSVEARIRFGDWGVVPFVDAGQVFTGTVPDFSGMSFGAGIGVRYYTSFGPVRVDVATPLNPGPNDPKVAFYVSIGQAF